MKLEKLNSSEETLTREQMLTLNGGLSSFLTGTQGHNTDLGTSNADDYDDADNDQQS